MLHSVVPEKIDGMKISRYIERAWPLIPGFAVRAALKKRDVRINGERASGDAAVYSGDEIKVFIDKKYEDFSLEILYIDQNLMAFVKPKGLPVDVDQDGIGEDTALSRLKRVHPDARLVHRLDAGTGGVMLAAVNEVCEEALLKAFKEHTVKKHYCALIKGIPSKEYRFMTAYHMKNAREAAVRVTDQEIPGSRKIETAYRVVSKQNVLGEWLTEADIEITTGRTHQIRAHMAHIGHPLVGDDKYGDRELMKKLHVSDVCLWCSSIGIVRLNGFLQYEGLTFSKERPDWKLATPEQKP